jgi:hypothetical protein
MATDAPGTTGQSSEPAEAPEVFYYSPSRYLWVMLCIAWSAFRHPLCTTIIDIRTGAMRHYSDEGEC